MPISDEPPSTRTVFVDFEASSLHKTSYPIEVAWVFEDGRAESHLIRPAPLWTDWADSAQRIHGIPRQRLVDEGTPHDIVARRMVDDLTGHKLYATAPSWDGQWLSKLLRAAALPRHALRLEDTTVAHDRLVRDIFSTAGLPEADARAMRGALLAEVAAETEDGSKPHRALADAQQELALWQRIRTRAEAFVAQRTGR